MYSASTLSGTESTSFWQYWDLLKNRIGEVVDVGERYRRLWDEARALADQTTDPVLQSRLADELYELSAAYNTWSDVKTYIDEWWGTWKSIGETVSSLPSLALSGMGILPVVLPAWALASLAAGGLAALTFVATHGLDLVQNYKTKELAIASIRQMIQSGQMTVNQGTNAIQTIAAPIQNAFTAFTSSMGGNIGQAIPWVIGIGALLYFGPQVLARYK